MDLNRAVAIGMADGPEAALPLVDAIAEPGSWTATTCCTRRAPTCCAGPAAAPRRRSYRAALDLAPTDAERRFLRGLLRLTGGTA